jgi:hypothetical protein
VKKKLAPLVILFVVIEVLTILPFFVTPVKGATTQDFYFQGPFDELGLDNTGHKPCEVRAYYYSGGFDEFTIYTDDGDWYHFIPDGADIQYFVFNFTWANATLQTYRQFWIDPADPYHGMGNGHAGAGELNIYNQTIYQYTLTFAATSGQLSSYPYVTIYDTFGHTIERRKMDAQFKIQAGLMLNQKYSIEIGPYSIGDFLTTSDLSPEIVVPAMTFPDPVDIGYLYVKAYADRTYEPTGNLDSIRFVYEDTKLNTNNVFLYIYYQDNMTLVHDPWVWTDVDSFAFSWDSADMSTDYFLVAVINHNDYGRLDYRNVYPRAFSNTTPFSLSFLGTLPFDSAYLIPAFILLVTAGIFSSLNAPVGLFATVVVAAFLAYFNWLPISADILVFCFALVFIFGIVMARRRYYG